MANTQDQKDERIARYIDQNLKQVFSEFESDDIPDQITDLLSVLRAQDDALKSEK